MKKLAFALCILMFMMCFVSCGEKTEKKPQAKPSINSDTADILEKTPNSSIKLNVADVEVSNGDVFNVVVSIDNDEWEWCTFEFCLSYDPKVIKINEIRSTEYTADMISTSNAEYGKDKLKVAYIVGDSKIGGGDIVEIECEAIAKGSFNMEVSEALMFRFVTIAATGDLTTREIPLEIKNGSVTVK